jgi:hypothetical protein
MAAGSVVIADGSGAVVLSKINEALLALVSSSCSPVGTPPAVTYPFMLWGDTTNGVLKYRNSGNTAWTDLTFPSGTVMLFAQAAAPSGWTQNAADISNNRMLRVVNASTTVNGAGAATGGSHDPYQCTVVASHTHTLTTGNQSADHVHSAWTGGRSAQHTHDYYRSSYGGAWGAGPFGPLDSSEYVTASGAETQDHGHAVGMGGTSANHTHTGTSDANAGAATWVPRYVNLIMCTKN